MTEDAACVRIDKAQIRDASLVLSKAFQDDPVFKYFVADPEVRRAKSHHIFNMLVQYSVKYGEVYANSATLEAVAVWLPHDKVTMSFWNGVRNGGLPNLFQLGPGCISRQLNASDTMCATHSALARYPHQYLYLLGSPPESRGKGYAGAVMRPMLARLDREGMPCYLDNTNAANMSMYQHYGFEVIKEYGVPKTNIRIWAMVRQPVKAKSSSL